MENGAKLVTISCAGHHETLVERLWHFFKTGQRLDFDFPNFGGHPVLAHLLVVDAFMPIDNLNDIGLLDGCDNVSASLDSLLEFMYRGTVSVPEEGVVELLKVARALGFKMLVDAVESSGPLTVCQEAESSHAGVVLEHVEDVAETDEPSEEVDQIETSNSETVPTSATEVQPEEPSEPTPKQPPTAQEIAFAIRTRRLKKRLERIRAQASQPQRPKGPKKLIQCEHCRYKTYCMNAFRVHMAKHDTSIAVDKCKSCGKKIPAGPASSQEHNCVDRYRYSCPHCSYCTYNKPRYQLHLATHDPASAMPVLKCPTCGKNFLRQAALDKHEAKYHAAKSDEPPETYSCSLCSFETKMRNTYKAHLFASHELDMYGVPLRKDIKCTECDFCCVRPSELKRHVTTHHNTEKPFKCPLCPYAAAHRTYLYMHNLRTHLKKKDHACDFCELRFHTRREMEIHKRIHTGEKPFVCEICGKAYADVTILRFHAKCHNYANSDRHICHLCGHRAKRHQYLKAHFMNVHKMDAVSAAALSKPGARPSTPAE